jgi:hypothetical protein
LFWLGNVPDPTGYTGDGGIEFRRLGRNQFRRPIGVLIDFSRYPAASTNRNSRSSTAYWSRAS